MENLTNQMNYFYVLEGVSCAGKTSTIKCLEESGICIIHENTRICNNFPHMPTNYKESRMNEKFILELEKKKCKFAESAANFVIADRMIISSLAVSYAWNYGTINEFINDIIRSIESTKNLFMCDCNVFLDIEYGAIAERNKQRNNFLGKEWVDKDVIKRHKNFYDIYRKVMSSENWYDIDSSKYTPDQIASKVKEIRVKRKEISVEQRLEEFNRLNENV